MWKVYMQKRNGRKMERYYVEASTKVEAFAKAEKDNPGWIAVSAFSDQ